MWKMPKCGNVEILHSAACPGAKAKHTYGKKLSFKKRLLLPLAFAKCNWTQQPLRGEAL